MYKFFGNLETFETINKDYKVKTQKKAFLKIVFEKQLRTYFNFYNLSRNLVLVWKTFSLSDFPRMNLVLIRNNCHSLPFSAILWEYIWLWIYRNDLSYKIFRKNFLSFENRWCRNNEHQEHGIYYTTKTDIETFSYYIYRYFKITSKTIGCKCNKLLVENNTFAQLTFGY